MIETIKGTITYLTASIALIGAMVMGYFAWSAPIPPDGGRDISILFAFLGIIVGSVTTFLFMRESQAQSAKISERAVAATERAVGVVTNGHTT